MASFPFNTGNNPTVETLTYRDAKGNTSHQKFYIDQGGATLIQIQTDMAAFITAFSALSNAALQSATGIVPIYGVAQYGTHATGGAYESVIDKAVMVYQDTAGTLHRYEVPAPKIAIFKNDKITVDPANSLVVAFNALMAAAWANGETVCSRQDLPLANYMGGFYKARKIRRRLNVLVLQPDLTASLPAE